MVVVALGPGKFYGSSLPRPRFYTDVKFSDERVDPPASVMEPLMQWASEAHWSMGGLSTKRLRLQGKIEGNVAKLRKERESFAEKRAEESLSPFRKSGLGGLEPINDSPPPAPISRKRRRFSMVSDDDEDGETERVKEKVNGVDDGSAAGAQSGAGKVNARRLARKLKDDFDLVADHKGAKGRRSPLKEVGNSATLGFKTRKTRTAAAAASETEGDEIAEIEVLTPPKSGKRAREDDGGSRKTSLKKGNGVQSVSASSPGVARKSPRFSKIKCS